MAAFFYGPIVKTQGKKTVAIKLAKAQFGYALKKSGINVLAKNKWSLTYQRTIMGTNETFTIDCMRINDTCRIFIDENQWKKIFN